jgi:signal transduction histidine kinase
MAARAWGARRVLRAGRCHPMSAKVNHRPPRQTMIPAPMNHLLKCVAASVRAPNLMCGCRTARPFTSIYPGHLSPAGARPLVFSGPWVWWVQYSVQQWGDGNLSVRVPVAGDDEVGFLATRFNRAAEQVETLVKARDALLASQKSLLANASHELRSPLTRIRMGLEFMPSPTDSAAGQAKEEIARNIGELDQLIDEILLSSRLDAKEADLGTIESVDLIGLAAEECARTEASLEVQADGGELAVPGVSKLLRRAVRNLLENARRHANGPAATLTLARDGAMALIRVCDSGPGVPEAFQERIFEPFYRLPGASERDGGVGLGLALVKSIALRHGGSVQCSNQASGGACFEIRLPLSAGQS